MGMRFLRIPRIPRIPSQVRAFFPRIPPLMATDPTDPTAGQSVSAVDHGRAVRLIRPGWPSWTGWPGAARRGWSWWPLSAALRHDHRPPGVTAWPLAKPRQGPPEDPAGNSADLSLRGATGYGGPPIGLDLSATACRSRRSQCCPCSNCDVLRVLVPCAETGDQV